MKIKTMSQAIAELDRVPAHIYYGLVLLSSLNVLAWGYIAYIAWSILS